MSNENIKSRFTPQQLDAWERARAVVGKARYVEYERADALFSQVILWPREDDLVVVWRNLSPGRNRKTWKIRVNVPNTEEAVGQWLGAYGASDWEKLLDIEVDVTTGDAKDIAEGNPPGRVLRSLQRAGHSRHGFMARLEAKATRQEG